MRKKIFLVLISFLIFTANVIANDTLEIDDSISSYDVSKHIKFLVDSTSNITVDKLLSGSNNNLKRYIGESPLNFGINKNPVWLNFNIINNSSTSEWIFEFDFPNLNDISVYIFDSNMQLDTMILTGLDHIHSNDQRMNYSHYFTKKLLANKTYDIYIKIQTVSYIILPIRIFNAKAYITKDRKKYTYLYVLYGAFLAILLFNLVLFALTRELNYLILTIYMVLLNALGYYLYGVGFNLFPDLSSFMRTRMRQVLFALSSLTFLIFTIKYLGLKKYRVLYRIFLVAIAIIIIYIPSIFISVESQHLFTRYTSFIYIFGTLFILGTGIFVYLKGEKIALFYIMSFSLHALASILYLLTLLGKLPYSSFLFHINSLAVDLFGILLTIGLVEKITKIRQEKEKSKQLKDLNLLLVKEIDERKEIEGELRESEEKFRLLFELNPQPISLTELKTGLIIDVNNQMEKALGASKHELLGNTSLELNVISVEDRKKIIEGLQNASPLLGVEMQLNPFVGEPIDYLIYTHIVLIHGEKVLISVFSDITEIKKSQDKLAKSEKQLRELNSTKDKFFSIIAHDLMNPFNALIGFTELLMESIKSNNHEESMNNAHFISYSSRRIFDLLQNLLIWSRTQSGKIAFTPSENNILELISNSIEVLKNFAHTKNVEIVIDILDDESIYVDQNMISTVIRNLVSNAIKFSDDGDKVIITVNKKDTNFIFCVSDSGVGIEPERLKEIFSINKTVSSIGTDSEVGIGLGLVLCHDFVNAHKGKLWAESETGKGSKFYFTIPPKFDL